MSIVPSSGFSASTNKLPAGVVYRVSTTMPVRTPRAAESLSVPSTRSMNRWLGDSPS
jgi:hypothetical protein